MIKRNIKKITAVLIAACMTFCMSGCGSNNDKTKDEKKNDKAAIETEKPSYKAGNLLEGVTAEKVDAIDIDDRYIKSSTEFSINLFKASVLSDVEAGKNVMISPESILLALSMTANGANGETLTQMENVLCNELKLDELNKYNYSFTNKQMNDSFVEFNIANSLWIKDDEIRIKVNDEFLKTDKTYYNADAFMEPFDDSTKDAINTWVSDNTKGMIKDILDRIDEDAVMYLVNAIAFEGEWQDKYEDYQINENTDFNNFDGSISKVNMLKSDESYYMHDDSARAFIKPYKGGQYGFMAILPNEGVSVCDYISSMTSESFMSLYNSKDFDVSVLAGIPEFIADYDYLVNDALKNMGMTEAFDKQYADFSNMGQTPDTLYINRVIHKTHIELDRNSTKAAAATVVEMNKESCAPGFEQVEEIVLDRPFIYAIVDIQTGLPVFIGVVNGL